MPRCGAWPVGLGESSRRAQSGRPHSTSTSFQDASPGDSPPATPPASPVSSAWQPFPEEDLDSPQFRRRAHTFSHPPSSTRRRITFQNGRSQSVRSPLLRQSCVETTRWVRACYATRLLSAEISVHEPHPCSFLWKLFLHYSEFCIFIFSLSSVPLNSLVLCSNSLIPELVIQGKHQSSKLIIRLDASEDLFIYLSVTSELSLFWQCP